MARIAFSPYEERDHDAVVALLNLITEGYGADILAVVTAKPSRTICVARDGERTVAVIVLALIGWSGDAHLRFLAVDAAHRSQGIGAALVSWARDTAAAVGMRRLYVDTSHDNVRAMQFYIRQGFIPEVCRFDFFKPGLHQVSLWVDLPYTGGVRTGSGGTDPTAFAPAVTIDRYRESDRDTVVALIDAITWQTDGLSVLENALRNRWIIFVARDRDVPIGTLILTVTQWNVTGHISMLSVAAGQQSRGIGTALLAAARILAREQSLRRLTVGTGHTNWRAQLFYLRNGFTPEVCRHDVGGRGVHEVLFRQDL